ncbi:O-antigen ligase family protein [Pontibacter kalidii]|uniref:O-antigen ligase family protein n=1 Tax=Pontibacter kalidii TaxID=2592049 RepID=UPI002257D3EA|nr:O-antigen ligase family protein [Pontibacter kalidii]
MKVSLLVLALLLAGLDYFVSKELNFLIICGVLLLLLPQDKAAVYGQLFRLLWPVTLLIGIGFLAGLMNLQELNRDFYRDIFLFAGVLVYIIGGVLLSKYVQSSDTFFQYFSLVVVLSSILHLGLVAANFGHFESLQKYREATGMTNLSEAIYVSFLFARLFNKEFRKLIPSLYGVNKIFAAVILVSFLLYFSRTMILTSVVLTFFLSNLINIRYFISSRNRRLPYAVLFLALIIVSSGFVVSLLPPQGFVTTLVEKFERAPEEVLWEDKNNYATPLADIRDNWRGYEASQGLKMFYKASDLKKFFGHGFGALIDLELRMRLAGKEYEKVPIIHNGYVALLVKSGILGLLFYLVFIYKVGFSKIDEHANQDVELYYYYQMLSGISVVLILNTFTMTGLFSQGSAYISIIMGLFIGIIKRKELSGSINSLHTSSHKKHVYSTVRG